MDHFHSDNLETSLFKTFDNLPNETFPNSVWFDDRQSPFLHVFNLSPVYAQIVLLPLSATTRDFVAA
jgi:hypothetical protein